MVGVAAARTVDLRRECVLAALVAPRQYGAAPCTTQNSLRCPVLPRKPAGAPAAGGASASPNCKPSWIAWARSAG